MKNKYDIKFYSTIKKILNKPFKIVFNPSVNGIENIPNKPYILCGNHKSLLDIPLLIISIPDEIHFMAKKELFDLVILKDIFSKMGAFPIDRDKADIKAIKESLRILKNKEVLGIFPEGTRNKTDDIVLPFKEGVTTLSNKTDSLIVPFGISWEYKRSKIKLNIGKPIDISKVEKEN